MDAPSAKSPTSQTRTVVRSLSRTSDQFFSQQDGTPTLGELICLVDLLTWEAFTDAFGLRSFEPRPANYSLLRMHTLPPTGGDTLFSSSYHHYDLLSLPMREFLSGLTATHHAEMFREQSRRHGFDLHMGPRGSPENVGDAFRTSHPIIRTNPTTGLNGLFVNTTFTSRIDQLSIDESDALLAYLFKLQHQSHGMSFVPCAVLYPHLVLTARLQLWQTVKCATDGTRTISPFGITGALFTVSSAVS